MKPQNEFAKMIPEHECDQDIITSVPAYDSYTVFPNKYGAWIQGAQKVVGVKSKFEKTARKTK